MRKEKCPYCGTECSADWVDVGVGSVQCGPYFCENCKASEIGGCDDIGFDRNLYDIWYKKNMVSNWNEKEKKFITVFIGTGESFFKVPKESTISQEEWDKGWFKPNSQMGSSVNTFLGNYVDHKEAKSLYSLGLLDEKNQNYEKGVK